ncbi:MAG TPA: HPr family phosphocarrier protein [Nocardioidaceae bacterium]|jgi:phosphocarrier protein
MPTVSVVVGSAVGLHARPAAIIADAAARLDSPVTLAMSGREPVDARSALLIMTLGAGHGDTVAVSGADPAGVRQIAALVQRDLDA